MTATTTTNDALLQMALGEEAFGEESGTGFRFLGQILTVETIPGKPFAEGAEPSEQIHIIVSNLGWYASGDFVLAGEDKKNRQEWANIKWTKTGQINKRTKFGVIMRAFAELIPGVRVTDLEGRVLWWEPTTIEFGTDKDGKPMTAKDVLMPVALPVPAELKMVEAAVGATAAAMSAPAAAEPEPEAFSVEETVNLVLFYTGHTAKEAQLTAIKDPTLNQGTKQAIVSGKAIGYLIANGLIVTAADTGIISATDKGTQLAIAA